MNQEEVLRIQQLNEERRSIQNKEIKSRAEKKAGAFKKAIKILKHPIVKPLIIGLGEIGSGGILPGCTGYVVWTYIEEKGSEKSPNIAEYLTIGIPAAAVDLIGLLSLTGVLLIFSYAVTLPCLGLIYFWGFLKHGSKGPKPTKIK